MGLGDEWEELGVKEDFGFYLTSRPADICARPGGGGRRRAPHSAPPRLITTSRLARFWLS
jgi:hypothetical protein